MKLFTYLILPCISVFLTTAQLTWASFTKNSHPFSNGSVTEIITRFILGYKIWLGIIMYIVATMLYFFALSKFKFFTIQLTVTGISIILSTVSSRLLLHENINMINIIGVLVVISGIYMVLQSGS